MHLRNVRAASLRACRAEEGTDTFLRVDGPSGADISAVGNGLGRARKAFDIAEETPIDAFQQDSNMLGGEQ